MALSIRVEHTHTPAGVAGRRVAPPGGSRRRPGDAMDASVTGATRWGPPRRRPLVGKRGTPPPLDLAVAGGVDGGGAARRRGRSYASTLRRRWLREGIWLWLVLRGGGGRSVCGRGRRRRRARSCIGLTRRRGGGGGAGCGGADAWGGGAASTGRAGALLYLPRASLPPAHLLALRQVREIASPSKPAPSFFCSEERNHVDSSYCTSASIHSMLVLDSFCCHGRNCYEFAIIFYIPWQIFVQ